MNTVHPANTIVLLDERQEGTVRLIEADRDSFCMSVQDAIQGCRFIASTYSAVQQIADLRDLLAEWIKERRESIHSAYMSFRSDGILFVVMQKDVCRDEKLSLDLTELDLTIASDQAFAELNFGVLSIPRSSQTGAAAFLSSGHVQKYAGQE